MVDNYFRGSPLENSAQANNPPQGQASVEATKGLAPLNSTPTPLNASPTPLNVNQTPQVGTQPTMTNQVTQPPAPPPTNMPQTMAPTDVPPPTAAMNMQQMYALQNQRPQGADMSAVPDADVQALNQAIGQLNEAIAAQGTGTLTMEQRALLVQYGLAQPGKLEQVEGPLRQTVADGHVGFLEVSFSRSEPQMGLTFDWSLPFPVVARVDPGSAAERKPQLSAGLVLIAINGSGIRIREPEVEKRLRVRPINLIFEAPAPERFDFFGTMKSWKKKLNKMRGRPSMLNASMSSLPMAANRSFSSTSQSFFDRFDEQQALSLPTAPPGSNLGHTLRRVSSVPRVLNSFDDMHGIRVADIRELHSPIKLPPVIRGGSNRPNTGVSWAGAAAAVAASPMRQAVSSKSLTWLATATPRPDPAYQHLIDDPRLVGPGCSDRWPLLHDERYLCRLTDMHLAWRTREAYEVGFRGKKFERTTQMHLTCAKGAPPLKKFVAKLDEIYCDLCGTDIVPQEKDRDNDREKSTHASPLVLHPIMLQSVEALKAEEEARKAKSLYPDEPPVLAGAMDTKTQGAFYYCRRCKRNGNRFELCVACHGIEVVQGEGKHHGKTLHPHFMRCQHRNLVRRRFVNDVCPGMPHIRRSMCDYCGHLAGSFDDDSEVWICERCPQEHGLRFEICVPCYTSMMTVSDGLDRIHALKTSLL